MNRKKFKTVFALSLVFIMLISVMKIISAADSSAIRLGSGNVLISAAPGAKSAYVGDSLTPVGTYSGSDFADTTIDSTRSFDVSELSASTVAGKSLSFHYSGATAGANEYVSVLLMSTSGNVLYYGKLKRIASTSDTSGIVSLTVPLIPTGAYMLYFFSEQTGASSDTASSFSTVSLVVLSDPYIITNTLPESTKGVSYRGAILEADTATAELTWSIISGSLPSGLFLDAATGAISGTPVTAGTFTFTVDVKNSDNISHQKTLSLKINPEMQLSFTSSELTGSQTSFDVPRGKAVTLTAEITGGTPRYSSYQWQVNGVTIDGATSSTYTIPANASTGTYIYSFSVTDSVRANATKDITVTFREPIAPTLLVGTAQFDKATPIDISFEKSDGDFTFSGVIRNGTYNLVSGSDYTVSGSTVTLSKNYLNSLPFGDTALTLDYDGTTTDPSIIINVINSALPPVLGSLSAVGAIERGTALPALTKPTITTHGSPVTSQGWTIKKTTDVTYSSFDPSALLDCSYNNAQICYFATNSAGTSYSNAITVTVNHAGSTTWSMDTQQHWHVCVCGEIFGTANHSCDASGDCIVCGYHCTHLFGEYVSDHNATCTSDGTKTRTCKYCGSRETITDTGSKTGHSWGSWQVDDTKHWKICANCGIKAEEGTHTGGTATCTKYAVCSVCKVLYGSLADHVFDQRVIDDKYLASPQTETQNAKYYYSCVCGAHGTETFESCDAGNHIFNQKNTDPKYLASAATCKTPAKYYYSCSCGECDTETFEYGELAPHTPGPAATYDAPQSCVVCGKELSPQLVEIILTPTKDNDPSNKDDKISFDSDKDIKDVTDVYVDDKKLNEDEYSVKDDGSGIEINKDVIDVTKPGATHKVTVNTPTGSGEAEFTIDGTDDGSWLLPYWPFFIIPLSLSSVGGLIVFFIQFKKKNSADNAAHAL